MPSIIESILKSRDGPLAKKVKQAAREESLQRLGFDEGERVNVDLDHTDDLPVKQAGIVDRIIDMNTPTIEMGVAESETEKGWYEVKLEKDFKSSPMIVATPEHRSGQFESKKMSPPDHGSPKQKIKSERPEIKKRIEKGFKRQTEEAGFKLYNEGRSAINEYVPDVAKGGVIDAYDATFSAVWHIGADTDQPDKESPMQSVAGYLGASLGEIVEEGIWGKAAELEDAINGEVQRGFEDLATNNSQAYRDVSNQAQDAMNESQKLLYKSVGMPEGSLMTNVMIRNATTGKFEYLGMEGGMKIHYIAIGE